MLLSAGHRDSIVEQYFESDVRTGCHRGPDAEITRMKIGAITDVLEHVFAFGKRRFSYPNHPFAAHMGITQR
ncbi:hypothetical protein D3C84_1171890 [compost metagenome]